MRAPRKRSSGPRIPLLGGFFGRGEYRTAGGTPYGSRRAALNIVTEEYMMEMLAAANVQKGHGQPILGGATPRRKGTPETVSRVKYPQRFSLSIALAILVLPVLTTGC